MHDFANIMYGAFMLFLVVNKLICYVFLLSFAILSVMTTLVNNNVFKYVCCIFVLQYETFTFAMSFAA